MVAHDLSLGRALTPTADEEEREEGHVREYARQVARLALGGAAAKARRVAVEAVVDDARKQIAAPHALFPRAGAILFAVGVDVPTPVASRPAVLTIFITALGGWTFRQGAAAREQGQQKAQKQSVAMHRCLLGGNQFRLVADKLAASGIIVNIINKKILVGIIM